MNVAVVVVVMPVATYLVLANSGILPVPRWLQWIVRR